jgi:hypothetical protein
MQHAAAILASDTERAWELPISVSVVIMARVLTRFIFSRTVHGPTLGLNQLPAQAKIAVQRRDEH